ncbi:uncharacterized protein EDB91DRAFT_1256509 [Suillus paluster]|uniref:uncharacterized protein n=1 Tax=Suillus paluster TaxID=48578 RepID=UPI001B87A942|nr:uncharacterized protein EDB91DRAFT_1256509 [Suillus paluster]KAG1721481.1 hypothetical protein EDB91DRAFT_1256509 [Suillus paluster]
MAQEISELKNYLPEWTAAQWEEKPGIFTAITQAVRLFAPKLDHGEWKKRKQNRDDVLKRIEEEYGAKPGGWDMFKHYQATVRKVIAELLDDELEKAKETAEEWSHSIPPPEIQAQVTGKKGPTYMEHFSNEMWRQCGMRVFVLSAWKNEQGQVLFGT